MGIGQNWAKVVLLGLLITMQYWHCQPAQPRIEQSFYYWRTHFNLAGTELQAMQQLPARRLYIRLFDVDWNEELSQPEPIGKITWQQPLPKGISWVPVVFITNHTLQKLTNAQADSLPNQIVRLLASIIQVHQLPRPAEIQIDCDWSASTRQRYFNLLTALQQHTGFATGIPYSVTLRLHQVKYAAQTGIPPVHRAMLMCYNMGNLRQPQVQNSIIEAGTLQSYIGNIGRYPLRLDVALPLFNWWVWFSNNQFKGIINSSNLPNLPTLQKKWHFSRDTSMMGYTFRAGDWLRYEDSPPETLLEVAELLSRKLAPVKQRHLAWFHLSQHTLQLYDTAQLQNVASRLR